MTHFLVLQLLCVFVCILAVLEFELRASDLLGKCLTPWAMPPAKLLFFFFFSFFVGLGVWTQFFVLAKQALYYFALELFAWAGLPILILSISASQVAKITHMSHQHSSYALTLCGPEFLDHQHFLNGCITGHKFAVKATPTSLSHST
jgi:hypothetical protein